MKFKLIDQAKATFPIIRLCQLLGVSPSGYFAWKDRPAGRRQRGDLVLLAHVRSAFALSNDTYGSPRMTRELQDNGFAVGRRRTARLSAATRFEGAPEAPVQAHHRQRAQLASGSQHHRLGLRDHGPEPEVGRKLWPSLLASTQPAA